MVMCRVGQNHIYTVYFCIGIFGREITKYTSYTVYIYCHTVNKYAVMYGVNMWSCTVYMYGSSQP